MNPLVPCPSCARHVRAADVSCPFCDAALPTELGARAVPTAGRRLERLAAFTFAATVAITGCTLSNTGSDTGEQEDELGGMQPMYGMPPWELDAGVKDSGHKDSGQKDGGKKDGGHVKDAGPAPCDPPIDDGGIFVMYGGPAFPEPCPAEDDGGAVHAMYGMPAFEP